MPFSIALNAAASAVAGVFALGKVGTWILKAVLLLGAAYLLRPRQPDGANRSSRDATETFSSGPARWIVGEQRVGGVIMYYGEDFDVKGTERNNLVKGGADDAHMIIALSEDECHNEAIRAVFVGSDRFNVKFNSDGSYKRREQEKLDPNAADYAEKLLGLPLDLHPGDGIEAVFNEVRDEWYESPRDGARQLNRDDPDDAEIIRKASLSGAVSVWPYMDAGNDDTRWRSIRKYTDDIENRYLREGFNINNPIRDTPMAADWTLDHKLEGIAGVHVRLRQWTKHDFDRRIFRSGTPQISFLVRGIKIEHPNPDASTGTIKQWTDNAAAIRYWWYTKRRGVDPVNIDRDAFVDAYNICNELIIPNRPAEWPNGVAPEWSKDDTIWGFKKYSINGVVSSGDKPAQIESEFNDAWQGAVSEDGGKLFFYPGSDRPSQAGIESADLAGMEYPTIQPAPALADRINAITMTMEQSSYHDYNQYSLSEIVDEKKRLEVDKDLHLPHDLGTWRWVVNPAAAYSLAIINLRRARYSTTTTLKLNPGTDDDPVKFIKMTPGLTYTLNIPEHGIGSQRVILLEKTINEDMTVNATFIHTPAGIYQSNYELPELPPRAPYIPNRMGIRPPKPTDLEVNSFARASSDSTFHFRIVASVDDSPYRKVFRLKAGDDVWEGETSESTKTFDVNVRAQEMEITVRNIDSEGIRSLPIREVFTPNYDNVILATPRWSDAFFHGATLRMSWSTEEFTDGISGVEVRFTKEPLDSTTELDILTENDWTDGELLATAPVQVIRGQDISIDAVIRESGRYNLFARYVTSVSGSLPIRGPISAARGIAISVAEDKVVPGEESPVWNGSYHNLYKWNSRYGNTKGESLMFPSHPVANREELRAIPYDLWNGDVQNSAVTTGTLPAWPFGRCAGYGDALDQTNRSAITGLLDPNNGGNSTWYLTQPIDIGTLKRIDVRAEAYPFGPGTDRISGITFGGVRIRSQVYKANTAIVSVVLPAVTNATGTLGNVTYELIGLPAGLSFNKSTRTLSGTPTIAGTNGRATYRASDGTGTSVELTFSWLVTNTLSVAGVPNQFKTTGRTYNSITLSWQHVSGGTNHANYYEIEYSTSSTGPFTRKTPVWSNGYIITGLDAETTYHMRIRGVSGAGAGNWHSTIQETTLAAPVIPNAPNSLQATDRSTDAIALSWTGASGVESYDLRWKYSGGETYPSSNIKTGLAHTIGQIDGLDANTAYIVQVRAVNSAGASAWSSELAVSTRAFTGNDLLDVITSVSASEADKRNHWSITTNQITPDYGTEISVNLVNPPPGYSTANQIFYFPAGTGPFKVYFAGPGFTYRIRVRKDQSNPSGTGLSHYTAWDTDTVTFTGTPHRPSAPTIFANSITSNGVQLRMNGEPTAIDFRLTYWKTSEPNVKYTYVLYNQSNPNPGQPFVRSHQFNTLSDNTEWNFTLALRNNNGWSLESDVTTFTTKIAYHTPGTIDISEGAYAVSRNQIQAFWTEDDDADSYEIQYRTTSGVGSTWTPVTGLTGSNAGIFGLLAGRAYRVRIRGVNSRATTKNGPWSNYTQIQMPDDARVRYPLQSSNVILTQNATNPRMIDWTVNLPYTQGVVGVIVSYLQHPSIDVGGDYVTNHTYPHRNGWVLFTDVANSRIQGTFDPGYSSRYWQVYFRVVVGNNDDLSSVPYTAGFGRLARASNSVTYNNVTYQNTFLNGAAPLSTPVITMSQRTFNADLDSQYQFIGPIIDFTNAQEDFETPDFTGAYNGVYTRNTVDVWVNDEKLGFWGFPNVNYFKNLNTLFYDINGRNIGAPYQNASSQYNTKAERIILTSVRRLIQSVLDIFREYRFNAGDVIRTRITRTEFGRIAVSAEASYTVKSIASAPNSDPLPPTINAPTISGRDVTFTWNDVVQADGYEVSLVEDEFGSGSETTTIVQIGTGRSYTKYGASNEHFDILVRAYRGDGNQRRYSSPVSKRVFTPVNPNAIGKITGLYTTVSGADLILHWNQVPNADGIERSFSEDGGSTWTTPHFFSGTSQHTMVNQAHAAVMLRVRAYKGSGDDRIYSTSYTHLAYTPVGSIASGTLQPIETLVAASRNGQIILDWNSPDTNHTPQPTRYEIESATNKAGPWTGRFSNLSGQVTHYQTSLDDGDAYWLRVRPETSSVNGVWSVVKYTPESNLPIGQVSATGTASYTTASAFWTPVENAQEYEVEYREGTSGAYTTWTDDDQSTQATITGLTPNTLYQERVRAKEGSNTGAWSDPVTVYTLTTKTLPAPQSVTMSTSGHIMRMTWAEVAEATGYEIRIDGKLTTANDYGLYSNVIVRVVGSDINALEINRVDFGSYLNSSTFDARARVKALFNDSPTNNWSPYVSIRWSPDGFVSPPGSALNVIPADSSSDNTTVNSHHLTGVNGTISLRGLDRNNSSGHTLYIRYTVPLAGDYIFRTSYIAENGTHPETTLAIAQGNNPALSTSTADASGAATITRTLPKGDIYLRHSLPVGFSDDPSHFSIQVSGPALPPGVVVAPIRLELSNDQINILEGTSASVNAKLNRSPGNNISVAITSDNADVTISPSTLLFTASNWASNQSVTVSAAHDADGVNDTANILFTGGGVSKTLEVEVDDDETLQLITNTNSVSVGEGEGAYITARLSVPPVGTDTTVVLSTTGGIELVQDTVGGGSQNLSLRRLTFTAQNYNIPQNIIIFSTLDSNTSNETATITLTPTNGGYNSGQAKTVNVNIIDGTPEDLKLIITAPTVVTENVASTVNVKSNRAPAGNLRFILNDTRESGSIGNIIFSPSASGRLTPVNWETGFNYEMTSRSDSDTAGGVFSLQGRTALIYSLSPDNRPWQVRGDKVNITVIDDDVLNIVPSKTSISMDEGTNTTLRIKLSHAVHDNYTVSLTSTNTDISLSKSSIVFTSSNWNIEQSVTVNALWDDDRVNDTGTIQLRGSNSDTRDADSSIDVSATIIDQVEPIPNITFSATTITVPEGGDNTVNVKLDAAPVGTRRINITSNNADVTTNPTHVTFTPSNWNVNQEVTISAELDSDHENETVTLTFTDGRTNPISGSIVINVTDSGATLITNPTNEIDIKEGESKTFLVKLSEPPLTGSSANVIVSAGSSKITVSPGNLYFTTSNYNVNQTVTVNANQDDDKTNDVVNVNMRTIYNDNTNTRLELNKTIKVNIEDDDRDKITGNWPSTGTHNKTRWELSSFAGEGYVLIPRRVAYSQSSPVDFYRLRIDLPEGQYKFEAISHSTGGAINYGKIRMVRSSDFDPSHSDDHILYEESNPSIYRPPRETITFDLRIENRTEDKDTADLYLTITKATDLSSQPSLSYSDGTLSPTKTLKGGYRDITAMDVLTGAKPGEVETANKSNHNFGFKWTPPLPGDWRIGIALGTDYSSFNNVFYLIHTAEKADSSRSPSSRLSIGKKFLSYLFRMNANTAYFFGLSLPTQVGGLGRCKIKLYNHYRVINIPNVTGNSETNTDDIEGAVKAAVAAGTNAATAETLNFNTSTYNFANKPGINKAVLPTFNERIETQCWTTGVEIDEYELPTPIQGLAPYKITVEGLPDGISFNERTRSLSGTPTQNAPLGGAATITLSDANGNTDIREMEWAIANPIPSSWSNFLGGLGGFTNPFQMTCNTKGNMRPFYYIQGGTNAQDIIDDETGARARAIWMKCPTTLPHTCRLLGAAATDYDLIIKVGDDWYISDTTDEKEFLSVPGHEDGAIIGIYRYEDPIATSGVNNTGDPLTLEWFTNVEYLPTEEQESGAVGLAEASADAETGANATGIVPGKSNTDIYVLWRNTQSGPWSRSASPLGTDWYDIGEDVREIRFEVHLKEWENRALRRLVHFTRDRD